MQDKKEENGEKEKKASENSGGEEKPIQSLASGDGLVYLAGRFVYDGPPS